MGATLAARPERSIRAAGPMTGPAGGAAGDSVPQRWRRRDLAILGAGLVAAVAVRLALLPTEGMRGDLDLFISWTHELATDVPLGHAYDLELTFGPVMVYLFRLIGLLVPAFQVPTDATNPVAAAAVKLPASVADIALAVLVAWALRERPRYAIAAALGIALVPVTWYVSAWWGQFESIYALFGCRRGYPRHPGPLDCRRRGAGARPRNEAAGHPVDRAVRGLRAGSPRPPASPGPRGRDGARALPPVAAVHPGGRADGLPGHDQRPAGHHVRRPVSASLEPLVDPPVIDRRRQPALRLRARSSGP